MKVISLDRFLTGLPEFVSGINNVVVATYNNLDSHEKSGEIVVGGKKITILCGGAAYANVELLPGLHVPNNGVQTTKTIGVNVISDNLMQVTTGSLVILYAGISCFSEITQLAYRMARRGVKVVLVGCGCDTSIFDNLEFNENISLVIPYGPCNGGRSDLSAIVRRIAEN